MKIFTTLLFTGLAICGGTSYAQIAAWDFTGESELATSTAEVYNANLDASNVLTRGAGAPASPGANSFRTQGFQNDGIATTNTDYFQVTLSAATGYSMSLSSINAEMRGTATFAGGAGASNQFAYSLDGTTFTLIGAPAVLTANGPIPQVDLSGIAALQNVAEGTTVTLRFYASGNTTTGGWGFYSGSAGAYGLAIGGTVNSTTIPCQVPLTGPTAAAVSVCSGNAATLSATGVLSGTTLSWYNVATNGTALETGATYNTGILTTGTSFWVEEAEDGCPAGPRTEVVVTVNALPTVNAGADMTVCTGANVTLSGSGAVDYTWNNGVTNGTAFPANATMTYTVTGTDANGCTDTDDITITVSGTAPTANAGPDQNVCAGASVSLTATGTGTFTWDNGVQQAVPFTATTTTTYTVTVDNGVCTNTDQVTINVSQPSVAGTATISDADACVGDQLTGSVTGQTGNVQWFVQAPGFPYMAAGTGATLTTPAITTAGTYLVKAAVTNGACPAVETAPITVVVNTLPTVNAGADFTVCAGVPVAVSGSGASTYTWNNGVTNGTNFTATTTTTYTVTGTDTHGCTDTDDITITVTPLPTVNAGTDQTVCSGENVILSGSGATSYTWNNGVTNGTPFQASATTTYTVTGTTNGCSNTDQVVVTVNQTPVATVTMANGAVLTASPAGMSYQWYECVNDQPTGPTTITYAPTANGTYKVRVTSPQGCVSYSDCISTTSVGLEDVKANEAITLFPNPTKGKVTLSMAEGTNVNVVVYNALGKVVATLSNAQNGSVIDLGTAQAGVYMVQVSGEKGNTIHRIVRN